MSITNQFQKIANAGGTDDTANDELQVPTIHIGNSTFTNVRTILQYEDAPLIRTAGAMARNFSIQFTIFNSDGVLLAVISESRMGLSPEGKKSNMKFHNYKQVTSCDLDGKQQFEIRREELMHWKVQAEIFTPDGRLINWVRKKPLRMVCGDRLVSVEKLNLSFPEPSEDIAIHIAKNGSTIISGK